MESIVQLLESVAEKYPHKVAIDDTNTSVTFLEYREKARRIGNYVYYKVKESKQPIIVLVEDSTESLLACIGVLYSGNFYIPIDDNLPEERKKEAIEVIKPSYILSKEEIQKVLLEKKEEDIRADILQHVQKEDFVFGMFTSGSTGKPKVVVKSHEAVMEMSKIFTETFDLSEQMVLGNQAPFYFDVAAKDIYLSMYHGATLYILPRKYFSFPVKLVELLNEKKVNTLIWSGFAMRLLEKFKVFKKLELETVELVMYSGEALSTKVIDYWLENTKGRLYNLYGTTETTFNCTYYQITKEHTDDIPIGKPFGKNQVYVMTEENKRAKAFESGEIRVAGACVATGYYRDEARTKEVFIKNPFSTDDFDRMYCTGDIGKYDEEGNIIFLSRKDNQIKHMGHRIELEEIERAVLCQEGVELCCCLYDKAKEKIILYYQGKEPRKKEIYAELKQKFPKQMLPNQLLYEKKLPLNPNGKIDRRAIKEKYFEA